MELVNDINKRLSRLTNNRDIPHRARMDITEAMRILNMLVEDLEVAEEGAANFKQVEAFCEDSPEFKELITTL